MTDLEKYKNIYTDKFFDHSYTELYSLLLKPIKESCTSVLEIGVNWWGGLKLYYDYFQNASIYGCDIYDKLTENELKIFANQYKFGEFNQQELNNIIKLKKSPRVFLNLNQDAYNKDYVKLNFIDKNIKFDCIIDDGPHTSKSQEQCIDLYLPLLSNKGILIIEDVGKIESLKSLENITPDEFKPFIKTYDLRKKKGRFDDIVFTIDKINS